MLNAVLRNFVLPVVLAVAPVAALPATAQAQTLRMDNQCSFANPDLHGMTKNQLIDACLGDGPADCTSMKTLAEVGKMDNQFVEAQAAAQVVETNCPTPGSTIGDQGIGHPVGFFEFERGYFTRYSGEKARTCATKYEGIAKITSTGVITFSSGGHDWRGTVDKNGVMVITHSGVTNPTPINDTAIIGPLEDAELYNGYCGYGFFHLLGKV